MKGCFKHTVFAFGLLSPQTKTEVIHGATEHKKVSV